jgi:hypothetical protein
MLVAALPPIATGTAAVPALPDVPAWLIGVGALLAVVPFGYVRDRGKAIEPTLWSSWGGEPVVAALRWATATNPVAHARLHAAVARVTGQALPDATAEADEPVHADQCYATASRDLRQLTKDHTRFHLVFDENRDYGMRRNLYGIRGLATVSAVAAALVAVIAAAATRIGDANGRPWLAIAVAVADLGYAAVLGRLVTADWVHRAADKLRAAIARRRRRTRPRATISRSGRRAWVLDLVEQRYRR